MYLISFNKQSLHIVRMMNKSFVSERERSVLKHADSVKKEQLSTHNYGSHVHVYVLMHKKNDMMSTDSLVVTFLPCSDGSLFDNQDERRLGPIATMMNCLHTRRQGGYSVLSVDLYQHSGSSLFLFRPVPFSYFCPSLSVSSCHKQFRNWNLYRWLRTNCSTVSATLWKSIAHTVYCVYVHVWEHKNSTISRANLDASLEKFVLYFTCPFESSTLSKLVGSTPRLSSSRAHWRQCGGSFLS